MKKLIVLLFVAAFIGSCRTTNKPKPYETTWLEITKTDSGYVVHNIPSLWNDGETQSPNMIIVSNNNLIDIYFSDQASIYKFDQVIVDADSSYLFPIGNYYRFAWVDREKHIARWTVYYGNAPELRKMREYLFIDSLYNTFPIVDFDWGPERPIAEF